MNSSPSEHLDWQGPLGRHLHSGRDLLVTVMLGGLLAILIPGWVGAGAGGGWAGRIDEEVTFSAAKLLMDIADGMLGRWLLPTMGFVLVLQCGSVDLSVWMCFALGASVAAATANAAPLAALPAAAGVGLAVGLINAGATSLLRIPGIIVTAATGVGCYCLTALLAGPAGLDEIAWAVPHWPRRLTAGLYVIALLTALVISTRWRRMKRPQKKVSLAAAMIGSGLLSALGGLCWVAKSGQAPPGDWRLIDPRVAAAAILAGGLYLRGRGRGLLAALLVPPALLATNIWAIFVCDAREFPLALNVLALAALAAGCHLACRRCDHSRLWRRLLVAALTGGGILVIASTAIINVRPARLEPASLCVCGLGLAMWLSGVAAALVCPRERAGGG